MESGQNLFRLFSAVTLRRYDRGLRQRLVLSVRADLCWRSLRSPEMELPIHEIHEIMSRLPPSQRQ